MYLLLWIGCGLIIFGLLLYKMDRRWAYGLLSASGIAVIAAWTGCVSDEAVEDEISRASSDEIIAISAPALAGAYQANEIAAEQKYGDKVVDVSGYIVTITEDLFGDYYLGLAHAPDRFTSDVDAYFSDKHVDQLVALSKGQLVTVRCKVDDYLVTVIARGCTIQ